MTTKTTPSSIREQVAEAEAAQLADSDAKRAELAEAREALAQRSHEQESAVTKLELVNDALASGSPTTTAAELGAVRLELEAANMAVAGAQQRVDTLARVGIVATHEVADTLLLPIQTMLPGVDIISTFVTPPSIGEADVPVAFLVQQEKATDPRNGSKGSGRISAEVRLHYFATVIHRPLEESTLERVMDDARIRLEGFMRVGTRELDGGLLENTARLRPSAVTPPVPTLDYHDYREGQLALGIASVLAKTSTRYRKNPRASATRISSTISEDGTRTVVLDLRATIAALGEFGVKGLSTLGSPESVVGGLIGDFESHLGRITSAQLVSTRYGDQEAEFVVRVELTSKVA